MIFWLQATLLFLFLISIMSNTQFQIVLFGMYGINTYHLHWHIFNEDLTLVVLLRIHVSFCFSGLTSNNLPLILSQRWQVWGNKIVSNNIIIYFLLHFLFTNNSNCQQILISFVSHKDVHDKGKKIWCFQHFFFKNTSVS